jgi:hypothetical protein
LTNSTNSDIGTPTGTRMSTLICVLPSCIGSNSLSALRLP